MHIPDGFLDATTITVTAGVSVLGLVFALGTLRRTLKPRQIPLIGLTAAFVFAAQMLNFPVAGGTSGHLLGAVLTAVLLGPSAAILVITAVLIVQGLVFADGGILALGANIFNMALVGVAGGYGVYRLVVRWFTGLRGQIMAAAFAGWCSVVLASAACAIQLAYSGTASWNVVLPAMTGVHLLIGIGEAVITALVLAAVAKIRPELLQAELSVPGAVRWGEVVMFGLLIAVGLAVLVAPWASNKPDGLEFVAQTRHFEDKAAEQPLVPAPIPDYLWPGVMSSAVATALAGGIGTVLMFGFAFLLAWGVTRKHPDPE